MVGQLIVVEKAADQAWAKATGIAVIAGDYVAKPDKFGARGTKVVNLTDDCSYLELGYYCSLLAEARGQKVVPTVETIVELSRKELYRDALPDLNAFLRTDIEKLAEPPKADFTLTICFGQTWEARFRNFARRIFDRFRCPLLQVQIVFEERWQIKSVQPIAPSALSPDEFNFCLSALEGYTRADWRARKQKTPPRYHLAILQNPREQLPPSDKEALKKFVSIGESLGIGVELIERKDYLRLGEFDALFIRETTSIGDHTYRFANKAQHEGLVVIDDPISILRCTNKVYLAELLQSHKLPAPKTVILDRDRVPQVEQQLSYPIVLKIPDGSFSRGIYKAEDRAQLIDLARKLFQRSDVILAQEFMYTDFDWRVGVLNQKPLFVSQYFMSRKHWQIVNHRADGKVVEGGYKTLSVEEAPKQVVEIAMKAANLIGDGLYGVDLKQNSNGIYVIEINDNPNLDRNCEDLVLKDDLYRIVLKEFIRRIEE